MMKSPAGRYPFSRFMASPSRAKRSELEHDSLASTLPGSIGGEAVVANMDGPDSRQRHVLGIRFGMGRKPVATEQTSVQRGGVVRALQFCCTSRRITFWTVDGNRCPRSRP